MHHEALLSFFKDGRRSRKNKESLEHRLTRGAFMRLPVPQRYPGHPSDIQAVTFINGYALGEESHLRLSWRKLDTK